MKKTNIVSLRERALKNGDVSLFLDYYENGERQQKALRLYLRPGDDRQTREENRKTRLLAETIRARMVVDLQQRRAGMAPQHELERVTEAAECIMASKDGNTRRTWVSALRVIRMYCETAGDPRLDEADQAWAQGFVRFVESVDNGVSTETRAISATTSTLYIQKMRKVFNDAVRDGRIARSPFASIAIPHPTNKERCYLTHDEVGRMVAETSAPDWVRRAFFFSMMTGLRYSDVRALTWGEVRREDGGVRLVFKQQKTGGLMYLDINASAEGLIGEKPEGVGADERVFHFKTETCMNKDIKAWARRAGVEKDVTFHVARHTFATLALTEGVDIYTVSKLLGHTNVTTTQVYAKIVDEKRREAVARLPQVHL